MKVAVYAIALNEEQFCERWARNTAAADYRLVLDTGSCDGTVGALATRGVNVVRAHIHPWSYGDARNVALALLPRDIDWCIAIDMDELLCEGWRARLSDANCTRLWCVCHFSEDHTLLDDRRIHARFGYRWRYPVHEELVPYGGAVDVLGESAIEIYHHPDPNKSRAHYLGMLQQAVKEYPESMRMRSYLAREYGYRGMKDEADAVMAEAMTAGAAPWP